MAKWSLDEYTENVQPDDDFVGYGKDGPIIGPQTDTNKTTAETVDSQGKVDVSKQTTLSGKTNKALEKSDKVITGDDVNDNANTVVNTPTSLEKLISKYDEQMRELSQENARSEKAARLSRSIAAIGDAISAISNMYGAAKGATPVKDVGTSKYLNDKITKDRLLRQKNMNELMQRQNDVIKSYISDKRANIYQQNADSRTRKVDADIAYLAAKEGFEKSKLELAIEKLKESGRYHDLLAEHWADGLAAKAILAEAKRNFDSKEKEKDREASAEQKEKDRKTQKEIAASKDPFSRINRTVGYDKEDFDW